MAIPSWWCCQARGCTFRRSHIITRNARSEPHLDRFAAEWISRFIDPGFEPHFRLGFSAGAWNPAVPLAQLFLGWNETLQRDVSARFSPLLALVAAFRAITAPGSSPCRWVEKTPRNERYVARRACFDEARFVQLVRDPRETFASLRESYRRGGVAGFDGIECARTIGQSLRLAGRDSLNVAERYLIVWYEDLVAQSATQLERVRCFPGIDPDPTLLIPTAGGRPVGANSSGGIGERGVISTPEAARSIRPEELSWLGVFCRSAARRFGYRIPRVGPLYEFITRLRPWPRRLVRHIRSEVRAVFSMLR